MDAQKRAGNHSDAASPSSNCKPELGSRAAFEWKVRVYYEDTDLGGVVYHANYLRFMERARTEWLRSLGFEQDMLRSQHSLQFVVIGAALKFHRPARFNDELQVSVSVTDIGRASLAMHQDVHVIGAEHMHVCSGEVCAACIDAYTFKPRSLPREILMELAK